MKQCGSNPRTCFQTGSGLPSHGVVGLLAPALMRECTALAGTKYLFLSPFFIFFSFFSIFLISWPPARPALSAGRAGQGQATLFAGSHGRAAAGDSGQRVCACQQLRVLSFADLDALIIFSASLSIPGVGQERDQT